MFVIQLPDRPHLVGPFASFLEAKEYLLDAFGHASAGKVWPVDPLDSRFLVEPGL